MWTTPLDLVDHEWTSLRNGSGERNVPALSLATGDKPAAERFPYPVGGTGALWRAIHDRLLEPERVHLSTRVQSLDLERRVAELADGRTVSYEYCISAGPITTAMRWTGQENLSREPAGQHPARGRPGLPRRAAAGAGRQDLALLPRPPRPVVPRDDAQQLRPRQRLPGPLEHPVRGAVLDTDRPPPRTAIGGTAASLQALGADPALIETRWHRTLPMGYPVPTLGRDAVLGR